MIPQHYFDKVKQHYNGDDKRAWEWFTQIHPAFGMLSPMAMLKLGRQSKVQNYIDKEMSYNATQKRHLTQDNR